MDWGTVITTAVVALGASTGFWAWLIASRKLTTTEYQSLVEEMRKERRDRTAEIVRLDGIIDRQDAEIHTLRLDLTTFEIHVDRLEREIEKLGGTAPPRPARLYGSARQQPPEQS